MITLRKLSSLAAETRRRKYPLLIQQLEREIKNAKSYSSTYFYGLFSMISSDSFYGDKVRMAAEQISRDLNGLNKKELLWKCNSLRHQLLSSIGAEPGDWDFDEEGREDRSHRLVGDLYLYLDGIRSPFNAGSIFRTAESFGIKEVFISQETVSPEHRRAKRSSMGCIDILPWSVRSLDQLVEPVFALELGGSPSNNFEFPEKGTLIIGSEELGVSPAALKLADSQLGRVSITTGGCKGSINVSVATGIVLQRWFSTIF